MVLVSCGPWGKVSSGLLEPDDWVFQTVKHIILQSQEDLDLNQWALRPNGRKFNRSRRTSHATRSLQSRKPRPPAEGEGPLEVRAEVLRPALERLEADILCLQEVNSQHAAGSDQRSLAALDQLLAGTRYAQYARVTTTAGKGHRVADVHNLVTLSRFPIRAHRELLHDLVAPPQYQLKTAIPPAVPLSTAGGLVWGS